MGKGGSSRPFAPRFAAPSYAGKRRIRDTRAVTPPQDEPDREVRDVYGTWRGRPLWSACLLLTALVLLINALAAYGVFLLLRTLN
jgi:hypothetical protein